MEEGDRSECERIVGSRKTAVRIAKRAQMPVIKTLIHMDGREHREHRKITNDWFKPANVRKNVETGLPGLARQYVDLTDKASIYEVTLVEVGIETLRTLVAQHPDQYEQVDQAITKTLDAYKARKSELMDQFARIYAQRLTMDELKQIVDFYTTPAGQKLATVASETNSDIVRHDLNGNHG